MKEVGFRLLNILVKISANNTIMVEYTYPDKCRDPKNIVLAINNVHTPIDNIL